MDNKLLDLVPEAAEKLMIAFRSVARITEKIGLALGAAENSLRILLMNFILLKMRK